MSSKRTAEHRPTTVPVRSLSVSVVSGPDAGLKKTGVEALSIGTGASNDLVLTDETVSKYHVELSQLEGRIRVRDLDSTNGTMAGPVTLGTGFVSVGAVLKLGTTELQVLDGETVSLELIGGDAFCGVRGKSAAMRALMRRAERIAKSNASTLIQGETGTGKEVFARAIHEASLRAEGPFETVDCGSLQASLVQSELFGHEPGAFTGAQSSHVGAFERANGGTLFLDEVGELPLALQPVLLGALERRSFRRLGGTKTIDVDVRVICATNRDLRSAINNRRFREDLYFRLAVVTLQLPPLRERVGDIPLLAQHFARAAGHDVSFEQLLGDIEPNSILHHAWPGNVRELRNFVEATLAVGEPPVLHSHSAPSEASAAWSEQSLNGLLHRAYKDARRLVLDEFEAKYFTAHLEKAGGNVSEVARATDMNRSYLVGLLKRHRK